MSEKTTLPPVLEPAPDLAINASKRLQQLAKKVVNRRPVKFGKLSFELPWLSDPAARAAIDVDMKPLISSDDYAIYEFTVREPHAYDALHEAFDCRPRMLDGDLLGYSRLNDPQQAQALYVGTSRKLRERVGQHVGRIGGAKTYSMRLARWATTVDATVDLRFWVYPAGTNSIELEALEQELWDYRSPLLGKRSGR